MGGVRRALTCAVALAVSAPAAHAATLADVVRGNDPAALVAHIVALGRTIDLADPHQVAAAIGPVQADPALGQQRVCRL